MKFRLAFVIGDTLEHDRLYGQYGSRSADVKKLCRHCDCPTQFITSPSHQVICLLWLPEDLTPMMSDSSNYQEDYFKSISHHPINNAFHRLKFCSHNPHNIYFAAPGGTLHMAQLGCAKQAVEAFNYLLKGGVLQSNIASMAQYYGASLSRQSNRNFPCTKFGTSNSRLQKRKGVTMQVYSFSFLFPLYQRLV